MSGGTAMRRRDLLTAWLAVTFASLLGLLPRGARAQDKYPSRPVRLIVPTPAGGVYDLMGRLFTDKIGPSLGTVIVENRAGGNATVGVTAAALSAPDGYTLLLGSNSSAGLFSQRARLLKRRYNSSAIEAVGCAAVCKSKTNDATCWDAAGDEVIE